MGAMVLVPAGEFWMGLTRAQVERLVEVCQREEQSVPRGNRRWYEQKRPSETECRSMLSADQPGRTLTTWAVLIDKRAIPVGRVHKLVDAQRICSARTMESSRMEVSL